MLRLTMNKESSKPKLMLYRLIKGSKLRISNTKITGLISILLLSISETSPSVIKIKVNGRVNSRNLGSSSRIAPRTKTRILIKIKI